MGIKTEKKIKKFLDKKLEKSFEFGKVEIMLEELEWIENTFTDVVLTNYVARELEKRRAILKDRLNVLNKNWEKLKTYPKKV